ncbi:restriction endonuclease subunit S [Aliarcobacter butzleri]|uniref:restriction endonuclease subunit S n=1 Tax=Aliarcobacter butzleri TaxID=28197 RepID=UPI002B24A249|nr:restriction endonuclease subunit S [Aliarcobacter butzleri]
MNSWKECKLGDVAEVIGGGTPSTSNNEFWNGNIPWLTPRDLTGYSKVYISHGERFITESGLKNSSAKLMPKGSVLLTSRAPIGYVVIAENEICTNQGFKSLVPNFEILNSEFLFYWLKSNTDYLQQLGTGTTFAEISGSVVKNIDISLPPLEEQKAIAEVLCSFDNKIDLLHRQNQTLESLAQTLFRQWFIEEAKEEWEEVTLSDVMELKYGKDHKHLNDGKIPIYGSGGIMRYGNTAIYENESILIPRKGTLSNIFYVDEPFWTVDTIFWSKINSEKISGKLLFEFLKTLNFSNMNVGSAVPSLTTKVLNEISFALPSLEEQEEFKQYTDNAWDKVKQNKKQIQTLENLRDTLLPKLLSGEVKIGG